MKLDGISGEAGVVIALVVLVAGVLMVSTFQALSQFGNSGSIHSSDGEWGEVEYDCSCKGIKVDCPNRIQGNWKMWCDDAVAHIVPCGTATPCVAKTIDF